MRASAGTVSVGSQCATCSLRTLDIVTEGGALLPRPRPRPPPGNPKPPPVNDLIVQVASLWLPPGPCPELVEGPKPSNFTCLIATSALPRLATMTFTFTGCPGTTTPASARAW